ncbi:hypothetical protein SCHAM137S_00308 [Streptomyces chartreusis]
MAPTAPLHPPGLRYVDLDEITAPRVREWRAERLRTTGAKTTVAKAYRLLKGILETAVDDDLISRNPCRIKARARNPLPKGASPPWPRSTPSPTRSVSAGASLFLHKEVKRHLAWYAEKGPEGLVFVGEKGAPLPASSFGRKWRRARTVAGLPDSFCFYDLRHTWAHRAVVVRDRLPGLGNKEPPGL